MKKNTERKIHLNTFFRKPFAAMTLVTAMTLPMNSMSSAQAQTVNSRTALQNKINTTSGGTITIENIGFSNTEHAIIVGGSSNNPNITIKGSNGVLDTKTESFIQSILSNVTNVSQLNNFSVDTSLLTHISGNNNTRNNSSISNNVAGSFYTQFKWFSTSDTAPNNGNGLGFENILFENVTISYDSTPSGNERKFVNGLIGNSYIAGSTSSNQLIPGSGDYGTSLGKLTGNAFSNIDVILKGTKDTNYLAGGGIIGVRNTGEYAKGSTSHKNQQNSLSAEMDIVSGNYFHDINITTTDTINKTLSYNATTSAYIEGGGIIGVNGVSSPDTSIGHALLKGLEKNAFTDIHILSNDVLLGGGIVGVNNNSKDTTGTISSNPTYAKMEYVTGNIFGNGIDKSITVDIGYSLRGGGVIGLNGLGSAQIDLPKLNENVFAGIDVTAGTYIKGGGIVGLQNNDDDYNKDTTSKDTTSIADFEAAYVNATDISKNVFVNLNVQVGNYADGSSQYLQGGGVIGLRSNKGVVILKNLKENVFKDI
ncbi:MAG: hypothetical protein LBC20_13960, partial [Planctomycetaceae bacterium]|nr:hypothetical protein [Planctomycetaceae bacterium]